MDEDGPDEEVAFREETRRLWVLELVIEVRADGVFVRLGPIQRSFRRVPAGRIESVQATAYAATTYSGWHWGLRRTPGGHTVYRLYGGRGVEITRTDGTRVFVGSRRPDELAAAIERVVEAAG